MMPENTGKERRAWERFLREFFGGEIPCPGGVRLLKDPGIFLNLIPLNL
jgi:hypothetical protein